MKIISNELLSSTWTPVSNCYFFPPYRLLLIVLKMWIICNNLFQILYVAIGQNFTFTVKHLFVHIEF